MIGAVVYASDTFTCVFMSGANGVCIYRNMVISRIYLASLIMQLEKLFFFNIVRN